MSPDASSSVSKLPKTGNRPARKRPCGRIGGADSREGIDCRRLSLASLRQQGQSAFNVSAKRVGVLML